MTLTDDAPATAADLVDRRERESPSSGSARLAPNAGVVERLWAVWSELNQWRDQVAVGLALRALLLLRRDHASTLAAVSEALGEAGRGDEASFLGAVRLHAAEHWVVVGRWDNALAELESAGRLPLPGALCLWRHGSAALVAGHRGDRTAWMAHVRAAERADIAPGEAHRFSRGLLAAKAIAEEDDDRPERALSLLLSAVDLARPEDSTAERELGEGWLAEVVRLGITVGNRTAAHDASSAADGLAERTGDGFAVALAQHCRGLWESEPALLLAAADAYERVPAPLHRGQALENAAVLLARRGLGPAARRAHGAAHAVYAHLKAAGDIRRANARMRPFGLGRPGLDRGRPIAGWEALTPSERTVAELVATGRTNPDIAAMLFLSRRTVQTHVSHILAKLGARSRVDIALAAADQERGAGITVPTR